MNREIKFRGKRIDDGKWVHGSYTSMREKNRNNPFCQVESKIFHRIWQWEDGDWNMGGYANYEVIPETVGQYTGLKDKNGVKIFEGDIVKCPDGDLQEITYDSIAFNLIVAYACNEQKMLKEYDIEDISKELEVVGNNIDNPDLLK